MSYPDLEAEGNETEIDRVRLVHSFGLPQINEDDYETIEITCRPQHSFPLTSTPKLNRPFTSDPLSAIFFIEAVFRRADFGAARYLTFTF